VTYPSEALALEVASDLSNVVLNHLSELSLVGDALDPGRKLRVPDKSVATEHLAVLGSESSGLVGSVESELAAGSLDSIPFHAVLRGDLTEIGLDDVGSLRRAEGTGVGTGTVVLLALGDEEGIEAGGVSGLASQSTSRAGGVGRRSLGRDASGSSWDRGRDTRSSGDRSGASSGSDTRDSSDTSADGIDCIAAGVGNSSGCSGDTSANDASSDRRSNASSGREGSRDDRRRSLSRGCNTTTGGRGTASRRRRSLSPASIAAPSTTVTPRAPLRLGNRSSNSAPGDCGGQSEEIGTHFVCF
jgi:hypothetical protein